MIEVVTSDPAALSEFNDRLSDSPYRIEAEARAILGAFQDSAEQEA